MERRNDPSATSLWTFVVGILVGVVGALLASTDEKGDTRTPVKSTVRKTKELLSDEGRVKEWAQSATEQAQKTFGKARMQVTEQIDLLRDKAGTVNKDKYSKAVGEVVAQLKAAGEVTVAQVKTLREFLMEDYKAITAAADKKPVKKSTKKA